MNGLTVKLSMFVMVYSTTKFAQRQVKQRVHWFSGGTNSQEESPALVGLGAFSYTSFTLSIDPSDGPLRTENVILVSSSMAYHLGEALAKQWVPPSGHSSPNV